MAQTLKEQYTFNYPIQIAKQIKNVYTQFDEKGFLESTKLEYDSYELLPRTKHIAKNLKKYLPSSYPKAIQILISSLGKKLVDDRSFGIESFLYMPYSYYIELYGIEYLEESLQAQYELTQRFTAEFCIRPFIEKYPEILFETLKKWSYDKYFHVRRLVSEGTRPRLPWANQLKDFIKEPSYILHLLELLKDDNTLYVRRSVANNLNDISKDNPNITLSICKSWMQNASEKRHKLVKHAVRTLIKKNNKEALSILGYGDSKGIEIQKIDINPIEAKVGDSIEFEFQIKNINNYTKNLLIDFSIDFVKANKKLSNKVFKLRTCSLSSNETTIFRKKISLKNMTTRKHYAGVHTVYLHLNGDVKTVGKFNLVSVE